MNDDIFLQEKRDLRLFIYIVIASLVLTGMYLSPDLITRDDVWPGHITANFRDARISVMPIYWPLVELFGYDMRYKLISWLLLNLSIAFFCFSITKKVFRDKRFNLSFLYSLLIMLSVTCVSSGYMHYKGALTILAGVFFFCGLTIKYEKNFWVVSFLHFFVFVSYQPFFLLSLVIHFLISYYNAGRTFTKDLFFCQLKTVLVFFILVLLGMSFLRSSFYFDAIDVDIATLRQGVNILPIEQYTERLSRYFTIVLKGLEFLIPGFLLGFILFGLCIQKRRYQFYFFLLLILLTILFIFNPLFLLNEAFATRVYQSFGASYLISIFVLMSIFTDVLKSPTKSSFTVIACVVLFSSLVNFQLALYIWVIFIVSLISVFIFKLRAFHLSLVILITSMTFLYSETFHGIEKLKLNSKLDYNIWTNVMFDAMEKKKDHKVVRIFLGQDKRHYYSVATQYSRVDYFKYNNLIKGLKFYDGQDKCEENYIPKSNELIYCY